MKQGDAMNPQQDQPTTPGADNPTNTPQNVDAPVQGLPADTPVEPSTPEVDAAAFQAIESLESDQTTTPQDTGTTPSSTDVATTPEPASTGDLGNPVNPVTIPATPEATDIPSSSSANPEATGLANAAGVSAAAPLVGSQASTAESTAQPTDKKKTSKVLVIVLAVVLVVLVVVAGYFVWQSMSA